MAAQQVRFHRFARRVPFSVRPFSFRRSLTSPSLFPLLPLPSSSQSLPQAYYQQLAAQSMAAGGGGGAGDSWGAHYQTQAAAQGQAQNPQQ